LIEVEGSHTTGEQGKLLPLRGTSLKPLETPRSRKTKVLEAVADTIGMIQLARAIFTFFLLFGVSFGLLFGIVFWPMFKHFIFG
jgi:hypothetical protein